MRKIERLNEYMKLKGLNDNKVTQEEFTDYKKKVNFYQNLNL